MFRLCTTGITKKHEK